MIRYDEIFGPTIQGEGALAGCVTMFVRTGGCDDRCKWCDTLHAVLPKYRPNWQPMAPATVVERLIMLGARGGMWVTISGGNPAIWRNELHPLVLALQQAEFRVAVETQGSVDNPAFAAMDLVTVSPKPPSSGNITPLRSVLGIVRSAKRVALKVVVFDQDDLDYAHTIARATRGFEFYVQPGTSGITDGPGELLSRYRWLCETVSTDSRCLDWRVLPQLHALAWGNKRGV